jgi:hypothetical protein
LGRQRAGAAGGHHRRSAQLRAQRGDDRFLGAFAGGALEGIIKLDIVDAGTGLDAPDDGKVHYDEFASSITEPLKFFEGEGLITVGLIAYVKFLWITKQYRSPTITLGEFNFGGQTGNPFIPGLGSFDGSGNFSLNMGADAQFRLISNKLDEAESFSIQSLSGGAQFAVSHTATRKYLTTSPKSSFGVAN